MTPYPDCTPISCPFCLPQRMCRAAIGRYAIRRTHLVARASHFRTKKSPAAGSCGGAEVSWRAVRQRLGIRVAEPVTLTTLRLSAPVSDYAFCRAIIGLSATSPQSQQSASGISDVSYLEGSATLLGDASMKKLLTVLVALGVAVSFMTPTFAAPPKTKAECEKAHMKWDAAAKTCS